MKLPSKGPIESGLVGDTWGRGSYRVCFKLKRQSVTLYLICCRLFDIVTTVNCKHSTLYYMKYRLFCERTLVYEISSYKEILDDGAIIWDSKL